MEISQLKCRLISGIGIAVFLMITACNVSGEEQQEEMISYEEIESQLVVGMHRSDVEAFFENHGIDYSFTSRETADREVRPRFEWKSEDAIGFYGGIVRNLESNSDRLFFPVRVHIRVEIDSQDEATQVLLERFQIMP